MKNAVNLGQPAFASILAERDGERSRLDPSLELGESTVLAAHLAMHRILQPFNQLFEVRDSCLEGRGRVRLGLRRRARFRHAGAPDLLDARDQALALSHAHS